MCRGGSFVPLLPLAHYSAQRTTALATLGEQKTCGQEKDHDDTRPGRVNPEEKLAADFGHTRLASQPCIICSQNQVRRVEPEP
jgi:hypothetical protein